MMEDDMILISLLLFVMLLLLMPLMFADLMASALIKLTLQPSTALILVVAIMLGGLINIPVKRLARTDTVLDHPSAVSRLRNILLAWPRFTRETIIAVNVGGCIIPLGLAIYEIIHLLKASGAAGASALAVTVPLNIAVCFFLARPIPNVGIVVPALVPAVVAALSAFLFLPHLAPPVAFAAGVIGPLVGADLMHIREFAGITTGIASIGGAGTFDGIVFSAIVAAYLA
jgi:uncharacterized membrane protein